jgi:3-oxoadipate enol-lactonase
MKLAINDCTINYSVRGNPKNTPLIFIHGFPFNLEQWKPQLTLLPDDLHMITYDVRGHGLSDVGDGQYTIDIFADDLILLLDGLSIGKAVICGLSMGGYIALRAYEKHPDRMIGLILCDTKSEADADQARIKRSMAISEIKRSGVDNFADEFVKTVLCEKTLKFNPVLVDKVKGMILGNSPLGICGTLTALAARTDTTGALQSMDMPVCIITGEDDRLSTPSMAKAMQERIKGSELHVLPDSAHMTNLENPDAFNKVLSSFLRKIMHSGK